MSISTSDAVTLVWGYLFSLGVLVLLVWRYM